MRPACEHREQLITEWHEAVVRFSHAVKRLRQCDGDARRFADEHHATEQARLHAENARMMLNLHRDEHGC